MRQGAWVTESALGESHPLPGALGFHRDKLAPQKILEILRHFQFRLNSPKCLENQASWLLCLMRLFITCPCLFVLTRDKGEKEPSGKENDPRGLGKQDQASML